MFENEYRPPPPPAPHPWMHKIAPRVILVLGIALILLPFGLFHRQTDDPAPEPVVTPAPNALPTPTPAPVLPLYNYPTPQTRLSETTNPDIYMPTGSGRVESAFFGSTRTNSSGLAQFHEGVDIGPVKRNRNGQAEDEIFAVADGKVGYISRVAGNSSYGIYVVLLHDDPVGEIYTLYSHLASVPSALKKGQHVTRGQVVGIMGHTSTLGIPVQRSHLHFEIGLKLNRHFSAWYNAQKLKPDHGEFHGFNLFGIDPLLLLLKLDPQSPQPFSLRQTLAEMPSAYRLAIHTTGKPDFFVRHPLLWEGEPYRRGVIVVDLSQNGVPLFGRNANESESSSVTPANPQVLDVNSTALGRNGTRHILSRGGKWIVSDGGKRWISIFLHGSGRG